MNPQGKGKIEWTDFTLSIVTGCEHGCNYGPDGCYANRIAQRIYKEKFKPTFRPERLKDKDLGKVKAGSKIFLSDMGDLFGDWVPDEWIEAHIELVKRFPQYTFQFLTKNPKRYGFFEFPSNCWLGATYDGFPLTALNVQILQKLPNKNLKFVSFEPLLGPFIPRDDEVESPTLEGIDWVIIGELTGPGAKESWEKQWSDVWMWAEDIQVEARHRSIPIFFKNGMGKSACIQEFPR